MRVERVKQSNPWRLPYRCCCCWGPGGTYSHHCGYHSYKEAAAAGVSLYIMYSFSLPPIPSDTLVTGLTVTTVVAGFKVSGVAAGRLSAT